MNDRGSLKPKLGNRLVHLPVGSIEHLWKADVTESQQKLLSPGFFFNIRVQFVGTVVKSNKRTILIT